MLTPLHTLVVLRTYAERKVSEQFEAERAVAARHGLIEAFTVVQIPHRDRSVRTEAYLDLLCDLTREESRDVLARMLAGRMGLVCEPTAPSFHLMGDGGWYLCSSVRAPDGKYVVTFYDADASYPEDGHTNIPIKGLALAKGADEALHIIALALFAEPQAGAPHAES